MEQELLAFFEQEKVKKELLKFAISDVKMVKEYGGDKAEYLALFEEQGSDKTSLEESGVSYPLQERLSKETYEKYLTTVEEADEESAEYFLEENGLKYAWLASDIIYYQDLMFKLSSPFNYEQVWDNDELIELDNSAGDIISLTVNELSLFDEKKIVYQAGEGHLTNNIDEAMALINIICLKQMIFIVNLEKKFITNSLNIHLMKLKNNVFENIMMKPMEWK